MTTISNVIKEDLHIPLNDHVDAATSEPAMADSYVPDHIKQIRKSKGKTPTSEEESKKKKETPAESGGFFKGVWNTIRGLPKKICDFFTPASGNPAESEGAPVAEGNPVESEGTSTSGETSAEKKETSTREEAPAESGGFLRGVWKGACDTVKRLSKKACDFFTPASGTPAESKGAPVAEGNPVEKKETPVLEEASAESGGFFERAWDGACDTVKGWSNTIKELSKKACDFFTPTSGNPAESEGNPAENRGFFERVWDGIRNFFSPKGGESNLKSVDEVEAEVEERNKNDQLYKDFGLMAKYNRSFLSMKGGNESDFEFMKTCKDPSIMLMYIMFKLQKSGNDNCEDAFRAWLKENEKAKFMAKERHRMSLENAGNIEYLTSAHNPAALVKTGGNAVGTIATIIGAIKGASAIGGQVSQVTTGVADMINSGIQKNIETNKADIDQASSLISNIESRASMIAQDLSRLYQTQSTLSSLMQAIMQDRKDRLSSIKIG
jgi:hypothetical protein